MQTEFREESLVIAQALQHHCATKRNQRGQRHFFQTAAKQLTLTPLISLICGVPVSEANDLTDVLAVIGIRRVSSFPQNPSGL